MEISTQTQELLALVRRYCLPDEIPAIHGTWLRQRGEMRFAPDRPWMPFAAEQTFPGPGINFRWRARVKMKPLLAVRVVDAFLDGRGGLRASLLGLLPVAHAGGPAANRAEAQRGLAELPWRPQAFGEAENCTWESPDAETLRATFDDGTTTASVDFQIGYEGKVLGARVSSRARIVGKDTIPTAWSGVFGKYRRFDRVLIPSTAEAIWHLPDGPFPYWRAEVTDYRVEV